MRRYASLIPLLLLVFAVNVVTPRVVWADSCLDHDETLVVESDGTWTTTDFVTDPLCNYSLEVYGTFKYKSATSDNADAFYRSDDVCDPTIYGADHCWVGDFTESMHGFTIGTLNSQARGQWVEGVGLVTRGFQSGLFSKEDSFRIERGVIGSLEERTFIYTVLDGLYTPGQGATGYHMRGGTGTTNIISTTSAFDGPIVGTVPLNMHMNTVRIETLASYRNASGSPWPNPRGAGILRSVGIWYDGPDFGWAVPVVWQEYENLIFEPIPDSPATTSWNSPYPERDPFGIYETIYAGNGEQWRFKIDDDNYTDNTGTLSVRIRGTDENPIRQFPRPLEYNDVDAVFDWFDTNGFPSNVYCEAGKITPEVPPCDGMPPTIYQLAYNHAPNIVNQTAWEAFAPVHIVEAGYVVEKRLITSTECSDMSVGTENAEPSSYGAKCLVEIPSWANPIDNKSMFIRSTTDSIYVIRVRHSDDTEMRYLVTNPRVNVGQEINKNCVVGETIPFEGYYNLNMFNTLFGGIYNNAYDDGWLTAGGFIRNATSQAITQAPRGLVIMGFVTNLLFENEQDIYLQGPYDRIELVDYSDAGNSCDTTANFADCISYNPQFFNEGEEWLDGNPAVPALWTNPGVILEPSSSIVLPNLPLDPMVAYGASLQIERFELNPFNSARVEVRIGQSVYPISSSGPISTQTIPAQTHTATNGVLYDLVLTNTGTSDVKIHYFCLSEGEIQTIPTCLLDNHSFDLGLSGWDTSGAVVSSGFVPGAVDLEDGDWISQAVLLNPGDSGPHSYTIEVEAEFSQTTGGQIVMEWGSTPVTGGGFVAPASGSSTIMRIVSGVLEVSSTATNDLKITVYVPDETGPSAEGKVTIRRVCILGPYPGQGGGGVITQPEGCGDIAYPDTPDVQTVLQWHWYQIDRFNRCNLIPRLTDIHKAILKGFEQLSDQFRFWKQVLYSVSSWMDTQLLPWLAGYLSNITPGTIIVDGGGECNDLFCFLTSLVDSVIGPIVRLFTDLIQQAANLLFSVIGGLLSVFVTLISQLFTLLQVVLQVFFGLIQQFVEAEPIPLPGMPDCEATPTSGICVVWWVADNTIFSGPGAAIIPLIVSILYIEYALWVIAEVKGIITRSAEAL